MYRCCCPGQRRILGTEGGDKQSNAAGADILVSIHCNAGGGKEVLPIYFGIPKQHQASKRLYKAITDEVGGIDRGIKEQNLHMVSESKIPALLTENLFVDVAAEAIVSSRSV